MHGRGLDWPALRYSKPANGAFGHPQRSANGVLALGGAFTQCFFSESSVDEIAVEVKQDPLALRRQLLAQAPRYLVVLELAASRAGWGSPLPPERARGIALHESFGSVVAHVAEVSAPGGWRRVHRVVCAIDCGSVVNPGIVAQQMEGAVVFALNRACRRWSQRRPMHCFR